MTISITLDDVEQAASRITGIVRRTPVIRSTFLSDCLGRDVWLKLETEQPTGSFKIRGAANRLLELEPDQRARGVIAASTGNHGQAVAHVARFLDIPATIVASRLVPANKLNAIRDLGADLVVTGRSQDDAIAEVTRRSQHDGSIVLPPFDDPAIIAGQGTVALEVLQQVPHTSCVVVPLSGGGLISGVVIATKGLRPHALVVGVSMDRGPAMYRSLQAGMPVEVDELDTLADSLGGGIGPNNQYTFAIVRDLVDRTLLVTEDEIANSIRALHNHDGVIVEGAAAVGVGALLAGQLDNLPTGAVTIIISGRNIDASLFRRIAAGTHTQTRYGK